MNLTRIIPAVFALLVFSCNPAKRAQRNDNKAVDRVTASRQLLSRVAPRVFELWPPDTNRVYIPGKRDSIPYPVYKYIDTATITWEDYITMDQAYSQSLDEAKVECDAALKTAYATGYKAAVRYITDSLSRVKIPAPVVDTLRDYGDSRVRLCEEQKLELRDRAIAAESKADVYRNQRNYLGWALALAVLVFLTGIILKLRR